LIGVQAGSEACNPVGLRGIQATASFVIREGLTEVGEDASDAARGGPQRVGRRTVYVRSIIVVNDVEGPVRRVHDKLGASGIPGRQDLALVNGGIRRSARTQPVRRIDESSVADKGPCGDDDLPWWTRVGTAVSAVLLLRSPSRVGHILIQVVAWNALPKEFELAVDGGVELWVSKEGDRPWLDEARAIEALVVHIVCEAPERSCAVVVILEHVHGVAHHRAQSGNVFVHEEA